MQEESQRYNNVIILLFLSGLLGFFLGILHATWQASVEISQVIAGIVKYSSQSPLYLCHTKMWTLLAQIPAIFLYFGVSEKTISIIIRGLAGMFSFQALTLCIFALSGKKLLALLSPLFIYLTEAASVFAGSYPVYLMAIIHTYGMIGLSFAILTLVLISLRQKRLGGFFAGLAPAVHFFIGIWLLIIILISFLWEKNTAIKRIKEMLPYLLLGLAITFISGLYQLVFIYYVP